MRGTKDIRRLTLDRYPDLTLAGARELAEIERGKIAKGHDPVVAKRAQKAEQEAADKRVRFCKIVPGYLKARIPKEENRRQIGVQFDHVLYQSPSYLQSFSELTCQQFPYPATRIVGRVRAMTSGPAIMGVRCLPLAASFCSKAGRSRRLKLQVQRRNERSICSGHPGAKSGRTCP